MSLSEDVLPVRSWDELIETSTRRGHRLRRRRRVVIASPLLTLALVAAAVPAANFVNLSGGRDRVVIPPASPDAPPVPARDRETVVSVDPVGAAPAPAPGAERAMPRRAGHQAPVAAPPQATPVASAPVVSPARPVVRVPLSTAVVVDDARGDGAPSAGTGIAVSSEPGRDIVQMTFSAEPAGVRVRMLLEGDRLDGSLFYAFLFTRSGCEIAFYLGEVNDGYFTRCGGSGGYSSYFPLPHVQDPSSRELEAFLPYEDFPATIRPEESFDRFRGESSIDSEVEGRHVTADIATGTGDLPGRRRP